MKKTLWTTFLITWMIIIFIFSNQNGEKSQKTSDGLIKNVVQAVYQISNQELTQEKEEEFIESTSLIVRKMAHFTVYFILGIISYFTLKSYQIKNIVFYSILICTLYACSDEIHQLFSIGRSGKILDVCIDTTGSILAICITSIIHKNKSEGIG